MGYSTGTVGGAKDNSLSNSPQDADPRHTARGQEDVPAVPEHIVKPNRIGRAVLNSTGRRSAHCPRCHEAEEQDVSTKRDQMPGVWLEILTCKLVVFSYD